MYTVMSSANSDSFTSFQFGFPLFLFLLWLLWLGIKILCWIKVVRVGIIVLFLIIKEMLLSFSLLSMMLALGLSCMAFIVLKYVPPMPRVFYHKEMWNFVKSFFCIHWDNHMIFILQFVNVVYHTDWFADIEPSLHPQDKPHLIMV